MRPRPYVNNRLVLSINAAVFSGDDEPVILAGNHLVLAPNHAAELQRRVGLLVVLGDGELRCLYHLRRRHVLDRLPTAQERRRLVAAERGGGDEEGREDEEEGERLMRLDESHGLEDCVRRFSGKVGG